MIAISIDIKNPTEVLGAYGILALDYLRDKQITRSRFVESLKLESGKDGRFRSGVFEFEHPDFAAFLDKCCDMTLSVNDNEETILALDNGRPVLTLDWYNSSLFIGDTGNFSQTDKLEFVKTHQQAVATIIDAAQDYKDLFSTAIHMPETNYLSSYNARKKSYQDAGGTYEAEKLFYASEFFLLVAMQVFRHHVEKYLWLRYRLRYSIFKEWLPTSAAFAGIVGGHHSCKQFESQKRKFGKAGSVLRVAQEVSQE